MRITVAPSMVSRCCKSLYREVINVTVCQARTRWLMAYFVTVDPPPPIGGNSLLIKRRFMVTRTLSYSQQSTVSFGHNTYVQQCQQARQQGETGIQGAQVALQAEALTYRLS